ncbi:MAG: peptide deformylase, partial [Mycoplasmataceae bacterium]|nr:peptide deformylase [Mycoplasmataceae bacterium]
YPLSKQDRTIMNQMIDYVRSSQDDSDKDGKRELVPAVGLSAVQIGHLKRMIYVRIENDYKKHNEEFALINPIVTYESENKTYLENGEACLSIRDKEYKGLVMRPMQVKIRAIDYFTDQEIEIDAKSLTAIVLMHEIDHLNGVMFYDRINKLAPFHIEKGSIKA